MPVVKKQSANGNSSPSKSGSLLGRMLPVKDTDSGGLHLSLYGRGKTGKTRLIASCPKPIAIIGSEDGTRSIKTIREIDFIKVVLSPNKIPSGGNGVTLAELPLLIDELKSSKYKTVAIDTASALQDIVLADMLDLSEVPVQWNPSRIAKDWGAATRSQYGVRALRVKEILTRALSLPQNIVITAHEMNFNEDESTDELLAPQVGSALSKSTAGWLNGAVDYICQTFIREEATTTEAELIPGVKQKITEKTGKKEFCLRVGPHPVFITGFRVPPGVELPDVIVNPTFDKIVQVINGTYKQ